jgi:hypothetical protein
MALRGRKSKSLHLKVVTGNPGGRPIVPDVAADMSPTQDNQLDPPRKLLKREVELWDSYIRTAPWLTPHDVPRAFMWVKLHAEFEKKPAEMVASRIAQLRALGSELGLDPASRTRIGGSGEKGETADPSEKYFKTIP